MMLYDLSACMFSSSGASHSSNHLPFSQKPFLAPPAPNVYPPHIDPSITPETLQEVRQGRMTSHYDLPSMLIHGSIE